MFQSKLAIPSVRFFQTPVSGCPKWFAKYVENGLCRIKWLVPAAIILLLIQGSNLIKFDLPAFLNAAKSIGRDEPLTTASLLIKLSLSVGIISCFSLILLNRKTSKINIAQMQILITTLGVITSQSLLVGFTHFDFRRFMPLDLALLILTSISTLRLVTLMFIIFYSVIIIIISAYLTACPLTPPHFGMLTHPLTWGTIGILVNRWQLRAFKTEWLNNILLNRQTRLLKRQKEQIELQRDEAVRNRDDLERQGLELFKALSCALTNPVAQAYFQEKQFRPQLRTVCVISCDIVGFSEYCRKLQPHRIVSELENFFTKFDAACFKFRVEPLRAQGDSRIAISGLWQEEGQNLHYASINAVLAMLAFKQVLPPSQNGNRSSGSAYVLWPARIGINLGPAYCGIINTSVNFAEPLNPHLLISSVAVENNKLSNDILSVVTDDTAVFGRLWFDVWGDTVNLAARLEEAAQPNQILSRESLLWETRDLFEHGPIHQIKVKNTTIPDAVEIFGIGEQYRDELGNPNEKFWQVYNDPSIRPVRPNPFGNKVNS